MNVILILILASLGMALLFLGAFIWAVRSGQFEDTCTPSLRLLAEEPAAPREPARAAGTPLDQSASGRAGNFSHSTTETLRQKP